MPPPELVLVMPGSVTALPETVQFVRVNMPELLMPPPSSAEPLEIVRPEMATLEPLLIEKMRKSGAFDAVVRCTVNRFAPGPLIVRFVCIANSLVSVIVLLAGKEKLIVPPDPALWIA